MGMRQATEKGRWRKHALTGYDMVTRELVPNEMAPLVRRAFELRAGGASFSKIEAEASDQLEPLMSPRVRLGERWA